MVMVDDDSTREDLALCLTNLVEQARREARRGYSGIMGKRYADLHANIDLILTELLAKCD